VSQEDDAPDTTNCSDFEKEDQDFAVDFDSNACDPVYELNYAETNDDSEPLRLQVIIGYMILWHDCCNPSNPVL
jgi:hypothetical protein